MSNEASSLPADHKEQIRPILPPSRLAKPFRGAAPALLLVGRKDRTGRLRGRPAPLCGAENRDSGFATTVDSGQNSYNTFSHGDKFQATAFGNMEIRPRVRSAKAFFRCPNNRQYWRKSPVPCRSAHANKLYHKPSTR